jgi:hypothetical protein
MRRIRGPASLGVLNLASRQGRIRLADDLSRFRAGRPSFRFEEEENAVPQSSKSLKQKILLAGLCFAFAAPVGAAVAAPANSNPVAAASVSSSPLVRTALSCPPGTHIGYEGKYCWPDRGRACPRGYHLGYEGKYCWPD